MCRDAHGDARQGAAELSFFMAKGKRRSKIVDRSSRGIAIRSAVASVNASYRFGHNRPAASSLVSKFGVTMAEARDIIDSVYGRGSNSSSNSRFDSIIPRTPAERAKNSGLSPAGVPGRALGFGNMFGW